MALAVFQRGLAGVFGEAAAEGALIAKAVLHRDVGERFAGEEQRVARRLHAGADDEGVRAHAEDFVEKPVKLPHGKFRDFRRNIHALLFRATGVRARGTGRTHGQSFFVATGSGPHLLLFPFLSLELGPAFV